MHSSWSEGDRIPVWGHRQFQLDVNQACYILLSILLEKMLEKEMGNCIPGSEMDSKVFTTSHPVSDWGVRGLVHLPCALTVTLLKGGLNTSRHHLESSWPGILFPSWLLDSQSTQASTSFPQSSLAALTPQQGTPEELPRTHKCSAVTWREFVPCGEALDPLGKEPRVNVFPLLTQMPWRHIACFLRWSYASKGLKSKDQLDNTSASLHWFSFFISFSLFMSFSLAPWNHPPK